MCVSQIMLQAERVGRDVKTKRPAWQGVHRKSRAAESLESTDGFDLLLMLLPYQHMVHFCIAGVEAL